METVADYVRGDWKRHIKRRTVSVLGALGLLPLAFELRTRLAPLRPGVLARNLRYAWRGAPDGLPLPSARACFLVAGSCDIGWFLEGGALAARSISEVLASNGIDLERTGAILDFGCGCGRVLRQWRTLAEPRVIGVDVQPLLVEECRRTVPFASAALVQPEPPIPYPDRTFGLVYALSVFTHFNESQQTKWRDEIRRILRPGGAWILTTQGSPYLGRLSRAEQEHFRAGRVVCQYGRHRGQNFCQAYHPEGYVRDVLSRGFEVLSYLPQGARGNPTQDLYLLTRT